MRFPSILNCEIAKSVYLKKPNIPMLPTTPIIKNVFFLIIDFA